MACEFCVSTLSSTAGSTLSSFLQRLWNPIERQIFYLIEYRSNLENLRRKARELDGLKADSLRRMDDAQNRDEEIMAEALNWLAETVQIEMDIEWLEERIAKAKGLCLHKYKLDWRTRHRLSKFAKKKTIQIDEHLPKGKIEIISFLARHADLTSLPTSDFIPLESSLKALNSTMEALKMENSNINVIGVHGSGGIGKTVLMKQVVKQIGREIIFDKVALVTVTDTPDLRRIQDEIANYLGFEIEGDIEYQRAATLSQRLKKRGRVLIILDDLWQKLNLAAVGLPYGEEHKGCKVIVTSRFEEVCNEMECSETIQIPELTDEDRKKLFKIKAQLPDSTAFDRAIEEVVSQCGKVANSIIIIGTALRNKPVNEWNNAIKKKKESTTISVEGISEEVVLCVTLGYDQLEQAHKDCLQFSCLFPPYYNVSMDEIVKFGLVDKLFPNVHSLGEVWNQMHQVVTKLKFSNLLLVGDREGCFKIHDDTRKVVKFIALKEGNNFIAEAGLKKGWPEDNLQNCEKLSLMDSNIAKLPDQPRCPKLLTLFLQNNALEEIPVNFFEDMRALRFLDLSYTNISSLPSSFECLEKLRSFSLENTHLRDASLIKEFIDLEVLTLKGSSIEQLPTEFGNMVNLKVLDLTNNIFLEGLPCNVISKLVQLEELYIGNSFGDWEIEGTTNQRNAGFSEVASLACLTVLYIHVKNTKLLSIDFDGPWTNLKKFRVCVNDDYWEIASPRSMHLKNLSSTLSNWVKLLLERQNTLLLLALWILKI